jgi:hypothetical protein
MEILGLVFVVILVVMGLLLLLLFIGKGQPTLKRFTESALAKNYLTTLAQTQTDCRAYTVEQLLQECAGGTGFRCPNGLDSCTFVQDVTNTITTQTLTAWNRNYSLVVESGEENVLQLGLITQGKRCPRDIEGAFYPIPFAGAFLLMNLTLCS